VKHASVGSEHVLTVFDALVRVRLGRGTVHCVLSLLFVPRFFVVDEFHRSCQMAWRRVI
jgi:hypothetical protein